MVEVSSGLLLFSGLEAWQLVNGGRRFAKKSEDCSFVGLLNPDALFL